MIRWFIVIVLFSCTIKDKKQEAVAGAQQSAYAPAYNMIKEAESIIKNGDLVLRSGQEFTSQFIRQISKKDQTYSHSGIVFIENGQPFIYHILSGDENPSGRLKRDSLKSFSNPRKNFGFAIYRYDLDSSEMDLFRQRIFNWYRQGLKFDSLFNLRTDDKMYCSEMIMKGLERATKNRIRIETTRPTKKQAEIFTNYLHLPAAYANKLDVITIDNLFVNPYCRLVKRFDFNPQQ
ncbi:MAG: hypothetical protein ACJ749_10690 [Flavisolibacter sp.]